MTIAAQFADDTLPGTHDADARIAPETGPYDARAAQRFDPDRTTDTDAPDFLLKPGPGNELNRPVMGWLLADT